MARGAPLLLAVVQSHLRAEMVRLAVGLSWREILFMGYFYDTPVRSGPQPRFKYALVRGRGFFRPYSAVLGLFGMVQRLVSSCEWPV